MNVKDRDELLIRIDERTMETHTAVNNIRDDIDVLFGQTRDHESRISNMEGSKSLFFRIIGIGGIAGGSTFGIGKLIERLFGHGPTGV